MVAVITAVTVFAVGVEQGIVLAVVLSLLDLVRRQYKPGDYVLTRTMPASRSTCRRRPARRACPG